MRATWDEAKGSQTQLADDGLRITALKKKTALPHEIAANRPLPTKAVLFFPRGRFDDCLDFDDRSFTVAHLDFQKSNGSPRLRASTFPRRHRQLA